MKPDDDTTKTTGKKHRHDRQTWPSPKQAKSQPHSWTNKSLHHPATRIGEIKHGKS